jgi:hypothetical protein
MFHVVMDMNNKVYCFGDNDDDQCNIPGEVIRVGAKHVSCGYR